MLALDERNIVHKLIGAAVVQVGCREIVAHSDVTRNSQKRESFFILPEWPAVRPVTVYPHPHDAQRLDREICIRMSPKLRNVLEIEPEPKFVDQRRAEGMDILG